MYGDLALRFRLFGFPISVSPIFVVVAAAISQGYARGSLVGLAGFVGIVFVSVLLHELGHAFTARAYGQTPSISFHALGGLTSWPERRELRPGPRLLVALAGPVAGLALAIAAYVGSRLFTADESAARRIVQEVAWINLGWFIFNLIPMLPLDGGKVMASLLDMVSSGRGSRAAAYISIVVALGVGAASVASGNIVAGVLCALFVYANAQDLRRPSPPARAVIDVDAQPLAGEEPLPPRPERRSGR